MASAAGGLVPTLTQYPAPEAKVYQLSGRRGTGGITGRLSDQEGPIDGGYGGGGGGSWEGGGRGGGS